MCASRVAPRVSPAKYKRRKITRLGWRLFPVECIEVTALWDLKRSKAKSDFIFHVLIISTLFEGTMIKWKPFYGNVRHEYLTKPDNACGLTVKSIETLTVYGVWTPFEFSREKLYGMCSSFGDFPRIFSKCVALLALSHLFDIDIRQAILEHHGSCYFHQIQHARGCRLRRCYHWTQVSSAVKGVIYVFCVVVWACTRSGYQYVCIGPRSHFVM